MSEFQRTLFEPVQQDFYTVSELNESIKAVLNDNFQDSVWVCGEIQGFNRNKDKRHIFFELSEKDPLSDDIVARIGMVIFERQKSNIRKILKEAENAFELKDDIEVKFLCKVDFYPPHGALRLIVESIDPVYTLGKIAQDRQKLIAELTKEGILEKNKKVPLTAVPLNIGLISSHDSAAYNDFLDELSKSGFGFQVFFENALMQGKKAEGDICRALDKLSKLKNLDVLVVTRGGGSIADLSCFDSRMIAEKIASLKIPVLSGIGHEINTTVTDLAAHRYEKTPTAVAQFLVARIEEFLNTVEENVLDIMNMAQEKMQFHKNRLHQFALALQNNTNVYLKSHREKIIRLSEDIKREPLLRLKEIKNRIQSDADQLTKTALRRLVDEKNRVKSYTKIIDVVHPDNTLKRGFSITRNRKGKVIKNIKDVASSDELATQTVGGSFISTVTKINKEA